MAYGRDSNLFVPLLLVKCFASQWQDQAAIDKLGSNGHGYASPTFHYKDGPVHGLESVREWQKCLLGRDDLPDDHTTYLLVRNRRFLNWVPQRDQLEVPVNPLLRANQRGDMMAKVRLMGVGGTGVGSLAWVERTGNEAFRQSENMAEWAQIMHDDYGIPFLTLGYFFLGLPMDGGLTAAEKLELKGPGIEELDLLWATGLFLTPYDLITLVKEVRIWTRGEVAQDTDPRFEAPRPSLSTTVIWGEKARIKLAEWAEPFFKEQCRVQELDPGQLFSKGAATTGRETNTGPYPEVRRRWRRTRPAGTGVTDERRKLKDELPQWNGWMEEEGDTAGREVFSTLPENLLI